MSIALIVSGTGPATPSTSGGTSAAINTTGANFLLIGVAYFATITLSDSKGNTWTPLTQHTSGSVRHQFFYVRNPVVGPGHTFSVTGSGIYTGFVVRAYAGTTGPPVFDGQNGATGSGTTLQSGSITPTTDGALIVSGLAVGGLSTPTVDAGLTATIRPGVSGLTLVCGLGDLVQATAAALNPRWTWTGTEGAAASGAVFTEAAPVAARVTQGVVEVLGATTATLIEGRVTQVLVETLTGALPIPVRVTHHAVEVFFTPRFPVRVTQVAVEAYFPLEVPTRSTQQVVEVYDGRSARTRATQAIVEVWWVPICGEEYPKLPTCEANGWPLLPGPSVTSYPILPPEECMDASTFITNMALQEIGISKAIASLLDDTSQEAYCARLIFTDVVDTVLRDHPWKFATEYAALVWLEGSLETPVNPDWTFTYHLPDDCVRVRRVCEPLMQRKYTVTPIPFDQRADADGVKDILMCSEPGGGQLELTDPPTITIEYTKRFACPGQVNDAQFRECLVMKMASRLAKALARDSKDADRALRNYTLALPKAQTQHANSQQVQRPTNADPDWIEGR